MSDPLNTPEVNLAAKRFMDLSVDVRNIARNMGAKSLARVFSAVVEFPFNQNTPKFRSTKEEELFIMALSLFEYKGTMSKAMSENEALIKQAQDQASAAVAEEILTKGG